MGFLEVYQCSYKAKTNQNLQLSTSFDPKLLSDHYINFLDGITFKQTIQKGFLEVYQCSYKAKTHQNHQLSTSFHPKLLSDHYIERVDRSCVCADLT